MNIENHPRKNKFIKYRNNLFFVLGIFLVSILISKNTDIELLTSFTSAVAILCFFLMLQQAYKITRLYRPATCPQCFKETDKTSHEDMHLEFCSQCDIYWDVGFRHES